MSNCTTLAGTLEAISDCKAVFVVLTGDGITEILQSRGTEAVAEYASEEIRHSLLTWDANGSCYYN